MDNSLLYRETFAIRHHPLSVKTDTLVSYNLHIKNAKIEKSANSGVFSVHLLLQGF